MMRTRCVGHNHVRLFGEVAVEHAGQLREMRWCKYTSHIVVFVSIYSDTHTHTHTHTVFLFSTSLLFS